MTKTERMRALLEGEKLAPPAMSLWRHFPVHDQGLREVVKNIICFQDCFQWDFVKAPGQRLYGLRDLGTAAESATGAAAGFDMKRGQDWEGLPVLPVADAVFTTTELVKRFKGKVPVIATVYSPLTTAAGMAGDRMLVHMRRSPDSFHRGLEAICETTVALVENVKAMGADGVFLVSQLGTYDKMSGEEYEEFGCPYDLRVLEPAGDMWFNILHMHGIAPMFGLLEQYPVQALHWNDGLSDISLSQGRRMSAKVLMGGMDENGLAECNGDGLREGFRHSMEQVPDGRLILAPGGPVPLHVPIECLARVKEVLAGI